MAKRRDCIVTTAVAATCNKCGTVYPEPLHMPENHRGWYCATCCPCCAPKATGADPAAIQGVRARWRERPTGGGSYLQGSVE